MKKLAFIAAVLILASQPVLSQGETVNFEGTFINSDPTPLQSGETGDITFKIVNTGSTEASDVSVELQDRYPFTVLEDRKTSYNLGNMAPGQEYQISTEVRVDEDADDGLQDFRLTVDHGDLERTVDIPVEVRDEDVQLSLANLNTQPSIIRPDTDDNTLKLELSNNGEETGENVVVNLDFPHGFEETSSFSSRQQLGDIGPGELKTADFVFDLNESTRSGSNELDASITYGDPDDEERTTVEETFSIQVEGKPIFEAELVSADLSEGNSGTVDLRITNVGTEEAESTRVRVKEASDQPFSFDSSNSYIGTLKPEASTRVEFDLTPDSGSSGDHLVDFQVRGVKGEEVFTEDQTVELSVEESSQSSPIRYLIVAGLVVGVLIYFRKSLIEKLRSLR